METNEQFIKEKIIEKFGSQKEFAKKIGYTESQLSKAIKKPSAKFKMKCKKAGVVIDIIEAKEKSKVVIAGRDVINHNQRLEKMIDRILELEDEVKQLKKKLEEITSME